MRALIVATAAILVGTPVSAQQWSAQQSEVWEAVQRLWDDYSSERLEDAFRAHHPQFVFWNSANSVPGTKEMADNLDTFWFKSSDFHETHATPLTIQVFDDFAIVNAYVRGFISEFGGAPKWATWRWHSGWKKEEGEWLCVSNFIYFEPQSQ
jgi:ketosteroid isomerase-like protein